MAQTLTILACNFQRLGGSQRQCHAAFGSGREVGLRWLKTVRIHSPRKDTRRALEELGQKLDVLASEAALAVNHR